MQIFNLNKSVDVRLNVEAETEYESFVTEYELEIEMSEN